MFTEPRLDTSKDDVDFVAGTPDSPEEDRIDREGYAEFRDSTGNYETQFVKGLNRHALNQLTLLRTMMQLRGTRPDSDIISPLRENPPKPYSEAVGEDLLKGSDPERVAEFDRIVAQVNEELDKDEPSLNLLAVHARQLAVLFETIPKPPAPLPHDAKISKKNGLFADAITPWLIPVAHVGRSIDPAEPQIQRALKTRKPAYREYLNGLENDYVEVEADSTFAAHALEKKKEYKNFAAKVYDYGQKHFPDSIRAYDNCVARYNEVIKEKPLNLDKIDAITKEILALLPRG